MKTLFLAAALALALPGAALAKHASATTNSAGDGIADGLNPSAYSHAGFHTRTHTVTAKGEPTKAKGTAIGHVTSTTGGITSNTKTIATVKGKTADNNNQRPSVKAKGRAISATNNNGVTRRTDIHAKAKAHGGEQITAHSSTGGLKASAYAGGDANANAKDAGKNVTVLSKKGGDVAIAYDKKGHFVVAVVTNKRATAYAGVAKEKNIVALTKGSLAEIKAKAFAFATATEYKATGKAFAASKGVTIDPTGNVAVGAYSFAKAIIDKGEGVDRAVMKLETGHCIWTHPDEKLYCRLPPSD